MYKGLRETQRLGVREVDGQTVSEPGQFCRNEREGRDRAMVWRMGGAEERSIPSMRGASWVGLEEEEELERARGGVVKGGLQQQPPPACWPPWLPDSVELGVGCWGPILIPFASLLISNTPSWIFS